MKSKCSATKNPDRKARGKNPEEPISTTAKRIFIVEDHPVLRESLVRVVIYVSEDVG